MKKSFLLLILAAAMVFTSCKKDETITISSDNIVLPLGSTNADLLKYATASDGSAVTVSGVNYDLVGEQTATFRAGEASATSAVKISASKIAGEYNIHVKDSAAEKEYTQGNGWRINIEEGDEYNQIKISTTLSDGKELFEGVSELLATLDENGGKIKSFEGNILFLQGPDKLTFLFSNLKYGKDVNGRYALQSFQIKGKASNYNDVYMQVQFDKRSDVGE